MSPDPRTQVGVFIIPTTGDVIAACNEPAPGFDVYDKHFKKNKYGVMEHAERNAIYECLREGIDTNGAVMVSPWAACADCARAIVLSGIKHVVRHKQLIKKSFKNWHASIKLGNKILERGGVEIHDYSFKKIGASPIRMDGKIWHP